jgi:hypothetical protein
MKRFAVLRLVLASVLFAGWIGWLVYLAKFKSKPIVLSRPQLLVSDLDVIAQVDDPKEKKVVVKEVYAWRGQDAPPAVGTTLDVDKLADCRRLPHDNEAAADVPPDWKGPGLYLLPLKYNKDTGSYEVVRIPESPGFSPVPGPPRIYPANDETLAQLRSIKKPGAANP